MAPSKQKKKSKGRQKIEMKFIQNDDARTTTFSKRKAGLFKKATEISYICGVQIAVIIFSMCGRAYSFGHPSAEWVATKLFGSVSTSTDHVGQSSAATDSSSSQMDKVKELKEGWDGLTQHIEAAKGKVAELYGKVSSTEIGDERIKKLSVSELVKMRQKLMTLKDQIRCKAKGEQLFVPSGNKVLLFGGENVGGQVNLAQVEMDQMDKSNWLKL